MATGVIELEHGLGTWKKVLMHLDGNFHLSEEQFVVPIPLLSFPIREKHSGGIGQWNRRRHRILSCKLSAAALWKGLLMMMMMMMMTTMIGNHLLGVIRRRRRRSEIAGFQYP